MIPVLTLDGPSGSGKGTVGIRVARALGWGFLDSGALYRILALATEQTGIALTDENGLAHLASQMEAEFHLPHNADEVEIRLQGKAIGPTIRTEACGEIASKIAAIPRVRSALLQRQRDFCKPPGLVADGRDMGTVVFPDARAKIFLQASVEARAERRYRQLKQKGLSASLEDLVRAIAARDQRDAGRLIAPLRPASDAYVLDSTILTIDDVVAQVVQVVGEKMGCPK